MTQTMGMPINEAIWDALTLLFYMIGVPLIIVITLVCCTLGCIRRFCYDEPIDYEAIVPKDTCYAVPATNKLGV